MQEKVRVVYDEGVTQQHQRSTFTERTAWILDGRTRFIELVEEITEHNNYFTSVLQLKRVNKPEQYQAADETDRVSQLTSNGSLI